MKSIAQTESLSLRPFFSIWIGQAFSLLGSQLVQFALIWWLTQTTESATVLATASLVGLLPGVVLGPIAGALVDRWNRRLTMIVADGIIALATVGLALLFWFGWAQIWHIYLLMFVRAVAGGFHWPAMQASTSLMVPKAQLGRIQGLNQMLNGGLNIASAPLGALLLELLPMQGVLAIDVVTALLAIVPLFFVLVPQPPCRETSETAQTGELSLWQDLYAGLRYVWGWPGLLMMMITATLINLVLTPAFSLLPILVVRHFGGGAIQLSGLESAWGIGVVLGGLLLSVWGGFRRQILTTLVGLLGLGLSTLVMGLTPDSSFFLAVGAMFAVGVMMPITNGPLLALVQGVVAPEVQGRVFTLMGSLSSAASPLGLIIAGPVADTLGVRVWFVLGGIVTMGMGVASFFIPAVMHIEDRSPHASEDDASVSGVLAGQGNAATPVAQG